MSRRFRLGLFATGGLPLVVLLLWGLHGLPTFGGFDGTVGRTLERVAVGQRHAANVVAAIVFDYRGLDTLAEEFILFASAAGVAFILRGELRVKDQRPLDEVSFSATRVAAVVMVPVTVLVGLWLAAFGYVTPGGGFQGGVALASAVALVWVGTSYRDYARLSPVAVIDATEGAGAAAYVVVGLVGLGVGGAFLANVIPLGEPGTLDSAGTIAALNWAAALAVAGANLLLFREFFQEYVQTFPGVEEER